MYTNQVFVFPLTTSELEPFEPAIALVFVSLHKVPPKDEMLRDVVDAWSDDTHGHVVPWHAPILGLAEFVLLPILYVFEVHDAVVVKVLARPHFVRDTLRMDIGQGMLVDVPPAKAQVQPTHKGHLIVYDNKLFVVCPVECHVSRVFEDVVIRMAHDLDVAVSWRPLGTKRLQRMLGVFRIARQSGLNLAIYDHVDLDSGLGAALENLVETPFLVVIRWAAEKELG